MFSSLHHSFSAHLPPGSFWLVLISSSHSAPSAPMVERPGSADPGQGCVLAPNFCTHKFGLALMRISRPIRSASGAEGVVGGRYRSPPGLSILSDQLTIHHSKETPAAVSSKNNSKGLGGSGVFDLPVHIKDSRRRTPLNFLRILHLGGLKKVSWASRPWLFSVTKTTGETPVIQVFQNAYCSSLHDSFNAHLPPGWLFAV